MTKKRKKSTWVVCRNGHQNLRTTVEEYSNKTEDPPRRYNYCLQCSAITRPCTAPKIGPEGGKP